MDGAQAEDQALRFLQGQGLKLVARNVRARGGELDLVLARDRILVIVEVRARAPSGYGSAEDSVTARKQRRVIQAARQFLAQHPEFSAHEVRFDVVALNGRQPPHWIRGAFEVADA
ncbi:MAG: YraN family protein [Gammaproteobacteria bacterium]|jgi:putative endonuclease